MVKSEEEYIKLQSDQEAEFWQKAYISGIDFMSTVVINKVHPILTPEHIADKAIMDFRKREL